MSDFETLADLPAGMKDRRVELHPATDAWMRGDRYGIVASVGRKYVHVKMDRSGRTLPVLPRNIGRIDP